MSLKYQKSQRREYLNKFRYLRFKLQISQKPKALFENLQRKNKIFL